jgi:hypothetical protein
MAPGSVKRRVGYILGVVKPAKARAAGKAATPGKAPAAAKNGGPAARGAAPASDQRAKLERELRAAITEIDEKGLLFLLRQAQVLIHNARVESMQQEPEEPSKGTGPLPVPRGHPDAVSIEPGKGGIFVTLGRVRKVFSAEEMKRLVRICWGADTKSEALRQLFTVLVKERKDVLADAFIGSPDNDLLRRFFDAIREAYHIEDR